MENKKLSLDVNNISLMRPNANVDPIYGPYESKQDAADALNEYKDIVKPGKIFSVNENNVVHQYVLTTDISSTTVTNIDSVAKKSANTEELAQVRNELWRELTDLQDNLDENVARIDEEIANIDVNMTSSDSVQFVDGQGQASYCNVSLARNAKSASVSDGITNPLVISSSVGDKGLTINMGKLVSKTPDNPLDFTNDGILLSYGEGLTVESGSLVLSNSAVDRYISGWSPIYLGSEFPNDDFPYFTIRVGSALRISSGSNPSLFVQIHDKGGIALTPFGLAISTGIGIGTDAQGRVNVNYSQGITTNNNNDIIANIGSGLIFVDNKITVRRFDDSLAFAPSGALKVNVDDVTIKLSSSASSSALYVDQSQIHPTISATKGSTTGVITSGDNQNIQLGTGLSIDGTVSGGYRIIVDTNWLTNFVQNIINGQ